MKTNIVFAILASAFAVLPPQVVRSQGTIYVSSLGLPSTGSASVGNNSWLAADFETGTNASGYLLNSVQLALADAVGSPSAFTAMIYNVNPHIVTGAFPGSSVGTLNGSSDPVAGGLYTYSAASNLALSPTTTYFIVLTSQTAVADGAYEWSVTSTHAPVLTGGWNGDHVLFSSVDGLNWGPGPGGYAQFALSATSVPEPSTLGLLTLGGLLLVRRRGKAKATGSP